MGADESERVGGRFDAINPRRQARRPAPLEGMLAELTVE